jgi:DNA uptake protein ComE-like DNA-binding protein
VKLRGEKNAVWIRSALLSWIVFAVYWGQLEWRAKLALDAFRDQSVHLLLNALNEIEAGRASLNSTFTPGENFFEERRADGKSQQGKKELVRHYNLNEIDSVRLELLPRIGPAIAGRVCRFREALGGFHSVEQLREVWGMHPDQADAIIPWFHVGSGIFRFLCLNESSWNEFRSHPYIKYDGAKILTPYRDAHHLSSVADLKDAIPVSDSLFRRWSPYLSLCNTSENDDIRRPSQRD